MLPFLQSFFLLLPSSQHPATVMATIMTMTALTTKITVAIAAGALYRNGRSRQRLVKLEHDLAQIRNKNQPELALARAQANRLRKERLDTLERLYGNRKQVENWKDW